MIKDGYELDMHPANIPPRRACILRYSFWVIDERRYCIKDLGRWLLSHAPVGHSFGFAVQVSRRISETFEIDHR